MRKVEEFIINNSLCFDYVIWVKKILLKWNEMKWNEMKWNENEI
jgi:hypothetical protein